jgi:hypothetical protein
MITRWIVLLGLAALLAACASPRGGEQQVTEPWNGGVWNSVLGYVGPYNQMGHSPGSR